MPTKRKADPIFTQQQRATLRAAGEVLLNVADAHFKRAAREVAKVAGGYAKRGLRAK